MGSVDEILLVALVLVWSSSCHLVPIALRSLASFSGCPAGHTKGSPVDLDVVDRIKEVLFVAIWESFGSPFGRKIGRPLLAANEP